MPTATRAVPPTKTKSVPVPRVAGTLEPVEASMNPHAGHMALTLEERGRLLRQDDAWREMEARLLSVGGDRLAYLPDHHAAELVKRGEVYAPKRRQLVRGQPNGCHGNAAALWLGRRPKVSLVTGWALSEDGCWRQHTWCWKKQGQVWIESTIHREIGFGIELDGMEGLKFAFGNLPTDQLTKLARAAWSADPGFAREVGVYPAAGGAR